MYVTDPDNIGNALYDNDVIDDTRCINIKRGIADASGVKNLVHDY